MEVKNKNILIGGLLAIVLVMAVGYAAFATSLNITGTAEITSSWDVHFNKAACTGGYSAQNGCAGDVTGAKTFSGGQLPTGTLTYGEGTAPLTATISASLNQPGDTVTFVLRIINAGTLDATTTGPTLSQTGNSFTIDQQNLTATQGHIKFSVTDLPTNPLTKNNGTDTMTIVATFLDDYACTSYEGNTVPTTSEACTAAHGTWGQATDGSGTTGNMASETSATLTIGLNYTQYVAPAQQSGN